MTALENTLIKILLCKERLQVIVRKGSGYNINTLIFRMCDKYYNILAYH